MSWINCFVTNENIQWLKLSVWLFVGLLFLEGISIFVFASLFVDKSANILLRLRNLFIIEMVA